MKKTILMIFLLCVGLASAATFRTSEGVDIDVTLLNQDPDPVSPSSYVDVRFKIENYGNEAFKDAYFKIIPVSPLSVDDSDNPIKSIGSIKPNQQGDEGVIVKFRLKVDTSAVEGVVPIKIAYKSGENGAWVEKEDYYVNVESSNRIVTVEEYETLPERFKAGEQGMIDLKLKNIADSDLKDIKISLTTNDDILPIGNTNEKVIDILGRGQSAVVSFNTIVSATTGTGVYSVPVNITYKDFKDASFSVRNVIAVIVDNTPEMLVHLDETSIKKAKTKGTVQVSISNAGVSDIKFLSYQLKETDQYKVLDNTFVYIGNIDSDDYETVESEIYVSSVEEDVMLNIELKYKDNFNKDYTVVKELPLKIFSDEEMVKYGYTAQNGGVSKIIGALVGIFVLIVLFAYWLFMLVDLSKKKMPKYKKLLWMLIVILGFALGALIYQLFGKGRGE